MIEPTEKRQMIHRLMQREGGFVDHPLDSGGPTKWGITLATLSASRGYQCSAADVRDLREDEATAIYLAGWFDHPRLRLAEWPYRRLAEVTLDAAVMFALGRSMAVRWVQEAINRRTGITENLPLVVDGWAGPKTLEIMSYRYESQLVADVIGSRVKKHARVVSARPDQVVFLEGWVNRAVRWIQ